MSEDASTSADSIETAFEDAFKNKSLSGPLQTANKPTQSGLPGLPGKKFVFKYRKLNQRAIEIISKRQLHFSNPSSLNDPFDCDLESIVEGPVEQLESLWEACFNEVIRVRQKERLMYTRYRDGFSDPKDERDDHNFWRSRLDDHHGRDVLLQFIEEYDSLLNGETAGNDPHHRRLLLKEFYASLIRLGKEKFGICSMGGDPTSILMWSHYADNHTGFALAFDASHRIIERQTGISHRPVDYSQDRKVNVAKEGWPNSFIKLYTRQAKEWRYEGESRYVSHNGPGPKKYKRYTLKGIIIGCRFSENLNNDASRELVNQLVALLEKENQERLSGSKIQIYLAHKKEGVFALDLKRLHDVAALKKYFSRYAPK